MLLKKQQQKTIKDVFLGFPNKCFLPPADNWGHQEPIISLLWFYTMSTDLTLL